MNSIWWNNKPKDSYPIYIFVIIIVKNEELLHCYYLEKLEKLPTSTSSICFFFLTLGNTFWRHVNDKKTLKSCKKKMVTEKEKEKVCKKDSEIVSLKIKCIC